MIKLRNIVEKSDTKAGVIFDLFVQFIIIFSIIVFSVETLPNIPKETSDLLFNLELLIITFFCSEYILRFVVAEKNLSSFFHFGGWLI